MKNHISKFSLILFFLLQCFICFSQQKNYYISLDGNDKNSGISPDQAWASLEKVNQVAQMLNPGDSILLRRGDTFHGGLNIEANGKLGDSLYIASYGAGEKPLISGAVRILNWEVWENGIYRAPYTGQPIQNMFANSQQLVLARYPNTGFIEIDAPNGVNGFSSDRLKNESERWSGANVLFRSNNWTWEKKVNNGFVPGTIVFKTVSQYETRQNWGFYLNNHIKALDAANEWYYSESEGYVYLKLPEGKNPDEMVIEALVYENGLSLSGNYCSVKNIDFEKHYNAAISSICSHVTISNCMVQQTCHYGIKIGAPFTTIMQCNIQKVNGLGIKLFSASNSKINNCVLNNIGLHPEMSLSGQQKQVGILVISCSNTEITYNQIDSTGYSGILFISNGCIVENNIVTNSMMRLNDGGGIYCFGETSKHGSISKNIVEYVYGYGAATESGEPEIFPGIYIDNQSNNLFVEKNTVAYAGGGIHGNAGTFNNRIAKNVCYGNQNSQFSMADWGTHEYIADYNVDSNIFVSVSENAPPLDYICYKDICEVEKRAEFSGNYYINPYDEKIGFPGNRNFRQWKSDIDTTAKIAFFNQEPGAPPKTELYINRTNQIKKVKLSGFYLDLDEQPVHEFQLQPYSSKVVVAVKPSAINNIPPKPNALIKYPNPIHPGEQITKAAIVQDKPVTISLIDLSGKCIIHKTMEKNNFTIPTNIPTGLYIIKAVVNHQIYTSKIIVNNTK